MSRKIIINKNKKIIQNSKSKRRSNPSPRQRMENSDLLSLEVAWKMLNDPCNQPQRAGLYGSAMGNVVPLRNLQFPPSYWDGNKFLYVIWFPDYINQGGTTSGILANIFMFAGPSGGTGPLGPGYGTGDATAPTTAITFPDPAYNIVSGDTYSTARTLSACLKVTYMGSTSAQAGTIYALTGVSPDMIKYGGTSSFTATFDQWISTCSSPGLRVSSRDVKHRPNLESSEFRDHLVPCITCGTASAPTIHANSTDAVGIGFVLYNVSNISDYQFEFYKNIEAKAEPAAGIRFPPPRGTDNPGLLSRAVNFLDRNFPNWQVAVKEGASMALSSALQAMVLGGRL